MYWLQKMGENSRVIQYHVDDRREVRKSNLHHRFYSMAEKKQKDTEQKRRESKESAERPREQENRKEIDREGQEKIALGIK